MSFSFDVAFLHALCDMCHQLFSAPIVSDNKQVTDACISLGILRTPADGESYITINTNPTVVPVFFPMAKMLAIHIIPNRYATGCKLAAGLAPHVEKFSNADDKPDSDTRKIVENNKDVKVTTLLYIGRIYVGNNDRPLLMATNMRFPTTCGMYVIPVPETEKYVQYEDNLELLSAHVKPTYKKKKTSGNTTKELQLIAPRRLQQSASDKNKKKQRGSKRKSICE
eukprot:Lithocolla_globosa_v1_NODE_270_length_4733_cov_5.457265.p2 type:complete len:225 gc:universal NODE_270_length_4733_cov_5.457265:2824-2150(-)